jgi:hypothetical protein
MDISTIGKLSGLVCGQEKLKLQRICALKVTGLHVSGGSIVLFFSDLSEMGNSPAASTPQTPIEHPARQEEFTVKLHRSSGIEGHR